MEDKIFSFETSRDVFLRSKCTSLEEEYIWLQVQPDGIADSNNATTSQAATREESARLLFVWPAAKDGSMVNRRKQRV